MSIKSILNGKTDLISGKPVTKKMISIAEDKLGLKFARDYKEYLTDFGIVAYGGHELTGISSSKRTNVVDVTLSLKQSMGNVPEDFYVIEETNIDDIVIWQDKSGMIFQSIGINPPTVLFESLSEYLQM